MVKIYLIKYSGHTPHRFAFVYQRKVIALLLMEIRALKRNKASVDLPEKSNSKNIKK